jgi:hypothetical protein
LVSVSLFLSFSLSLSLSNRLLTSYPPSPVSQCCDACPFTHRARLPLTMSSIAHR